MFDQPDGGVIGRGVGAGVLEQLQRVRDVLPGAGLQTRQVLVHLAAVTAAAIAASNAASRKEERGWSGGT